MIKNNKKILSILLTLGFALSMFSTSSLAMEPIQESNNALTVKEEIPISEALKMVEGKASARTLNSLGNIEKAYLMNNGQVCFKVTETVTDHASTETTERESSYIPIADNINLFETTNTSNYTHMWSEDTDINVFYGQAEGYGVVSAYRSNENSSDWYLEMKANARGSNPAFYLESFSWTVSHDNEQTVLYDWSPSGFTTATKDIFPVDISVEAPGGVTISSSFDLLARDTTLNGGVSGGEYSVELYTDGFDIIYPNYQDLDALVSYLTGSGTTEWTWHWSATAYLLV